jgi:HSP20 family molecular chaperone IbpA
MMKLVRFEICETEDVIAVKAVFPGYDAKDIQIHVEPQPPLISGRQQENSGGTKTKTLEPVQRSEQIFHCIDLSGVG